MRVKHRHIIYIQGYDPRGLAQYYRMFRTELRKFARLYGVAATTTRPQAADSGDLHADYNTDSMFLDSQIAEEKREEAETFQALHIGVGVRGAVVGPDGAGLHP